MAAELSFEFGVVGFSIAGVACARAMRGGGAHVCLLPQLRDYPIRAQLEVGPTPLNAQPMVSFMWELMAAEELERLGVALYTAEFTPPRLPRSNVLTLDCAALGAYRGPETPIGELSLNAAVFASDNYGRELPRRLHQGRYAMGKGLCSDADSDGPFTRGHEAAVVGCGTYAAEQARMLLDLGITVTVICDKQSSPAIERLSAATNPAGRLTVLTGAAIEEILPDDDGHIRMLSLICSGEKRLLPAWDVYVANDPRPDWSIWGGKRRAHQLIRDHKLYLAGIPAGIPYGDHAALWKDGERAARECLREHGFSAVGAPPAD